jgi:predicted metal-dependent hydrolase
MSKKLFVYGERSYEYTLEAQKRKTLSLTVHPDASLTLKCPLEADEDRINTFLRKKWLWLYKQLAFFGKYKKVQYKKEYVSGESFLYLGKQYQLIVLKSETNRVVLQNGKLVVYTNGLVRDGKKNQKLLSAWYRTRLILVFRERLFKLAPKFGLNYVPEFSIKKMDKRWGSFVHGSIILNPRLIHASKDCIDYVITHELCHFKHKKHDKEFYKLLSKKMPGWEKIKEKLEVGLG